MLFEGCVQVVQHQARLHGGGALLCVDRHDLAHVFGVVDDQARTHGLATLAGAAAARHDGHAQIAANVHGQAHIGRITRHKHTQGHDLVNRGIGGVAASVGGRKQHFALGVLAQPLGQRSSHLVAAGSHFFVGVFRRGL